jgi:hypothetical protein
MNTFLSRQGEVVLESTVMEKFKNFKSQQVKKLNELYVGKEIYPADFDMANEFDLMQFRNDGATELEHELNNEMQHLFKSTQDNWKAMKRGHDMQVEQRIDHDVWVSRK